MRKRYIDNLRTFMIMLLFPVHTFMIWNDYGTRFYIWSGENRVLSSLIIFVNPWFMSVLFVLAGMCARYSLKKRGAKKFLKERLTKLLVPLFFGIIFLVPIQTLYARKFFYGYNGGMLDNCKYFFTHITDLSGYDGCFTPGHLWFILFLFIISVLGLLPAKFAPYEKFCARFERIRAFQIILLFVPVWISYYIGNFGGYSLGKYFMLYILGYYLFNDENIEKIIKRKEIILPLFIVSQTALVIMYFRYKYYGDLFVNFVGWLGVLSCIITGKLFFDKENKLLKYMKSASFPTYILHQSILVTVGYYALKIIKDTFFQVIVILSLSFVFTVASYEVIKRIPVLRKIIGIR